MRALHLSTEFPPLIYGGLGTAVGGLAFALAEAGISVAVLLVGNTGRGGYAGQAPNLVRGATEGREDREVAIFEVSYHDFEAMALLTAKWKPDVLHLHSYWLWPTAEALRRRLGVPLVYTVHSLDRAEYELGQGPSECLSQWTGQEGVILAADRIIALSRSERELLCRYCPGVDDRVRIVGNGIEDWNTAPQPRENNDSGPVVLFSGRFVDRKGIWELIEAVEIVLAQMTDVRFILAGGHRHCGAEQMEAWLLPPGLRERRGNIRFTGWLTPEEMSGCYRAADILVVPSWYEPFGMVVLEGMLHGLAVAASAVGGPAEILEHGRTGLLFPPRDGKALAGAIIELGSNPHRRHALAKAGAEEVRRTWLWPRVVEKIRSVYEELAPQPTLFPLGPPDGSPETPKAPYRA